MGNYNRKVNEMFDRNIVLNNGVKIPQLGLGTWFIDRIEKATAKSYLFIYVRNRAIDNLRHQDIHYAYAEFSQKLYENYTEVEFKEQDERMMKIQKVLDGMTPHTRHILEECYLHEKKYKEVAAE